MDFDYDYDFYLANEAKRKGVATRLGEGVKSGVNLLGQMGSGISKGYCVGTAGKGHMALKIFIAILVFIIWIISIASLDYCQTILGNIKSGECSAADNIDDVKKLYSLSVTALVLSTIYVICTLMDYR